MIELDNVSLAPSVAQCTGLAARPTQVLQAYDEARKAEALTACEAAAQAAPGNSNVQYLLGDVYSLNGDLSAAVKSYERAADLGDAKGFARIGSLYYFGTGVGRDLQQAVNWFRRAAEKGDAGSMTYLGYAYRNGEGVARDYKEAMKWFRRAADKGDAAAMTNIGNAYHNAEGVERNYQEAMKWFRLAADKGDAGAMRNIGICYENGDGVARDIEQARRWYLQAEATSPGIAKQDLANLEAASPGRS